MKNYCICKIKKGIIYRDKDCPARFHNGHNKIEEIELVNAGYIRVSLFPPVWVKGIKGTDIIC